MSIDIDPGFRRRPTAGTRMDQPTNIPEVGLTPALKESERPDPHAHMYPEKGGVHVPNVPRYPSGFREWHHIEPET